MSQPPLPPLSYHATHAQVYARHHDYPSLSAAQHHPAVKRVVQCIQQRKSRRVVDDKTAYEWHREKTYREQHQEAERAARAVTIQPGPGNESPKRKRRRAQADSPTDASAETPLAAAVIVPQLSHSADSPAHSSHSSPTGKQVPVRPKATKRPSSDPLSSAFTPVASSSSSSSSSSYFSPPPLDYSTPPSSLTPPSPYSSDSLASLDSDFSALQARLAAVERRHTRVHDSHSDMVARMAALEQSQGEVRAQLRALAQQQSTVDRYSNALNDSFDSRLTSLEARTATLQQQQLQPGELQAIVWSMLHLSKEEKTKEEHEEKYQ